MINLTDSAASHFANMLQNNDKAIGLHIGLKKAGCSGLAYVLELVETMPENSNKYVLNNFAIIIADKDLENLRDLTVDYISDKMGGHIKFVNPNSTGECGCGESFSVK